MTKFYLLRATSYSRAMDMEETECAIVAAVNFEEVMKMISERFPALTACTIREIRDEEDFIWISSDTYLKTANNGLVAIF